MVSPKKTPSPPDRELPASARLGPELRAQVEAVCEAEGISVSQFIRDAVVVGVQSKPGRQVRVLSRSLSVAAAQFEHALKLGVLKGTEAEKQADEVRAFFGEFLAMLKDQGRDGDAAEPEDLEVD